MTGPDAFVTLALVLLVLSLLVIIVSTLRAGSMDPLPPPPLWDDPPGAWDPREAHEPGEDYDDDRADLVTIAPCSCRKCEPERVEVPCDCEKCEAIRALVTDAVGRALDRPSELPPPPPMCDYRASGVRCALVAGHITDHCHDGATCYLPAHRMLAWDKGGTDD